MEPPEKIDAVKVAVRIRPLLQKEQNDGRICMWESKENSLHQRDENHPLYTFDCVYDENSTTYELHDEVSSPIVKAAMTGFHGTVFAYGQSGSGKTFTMSGSKMAPGLIRQAAEQIFNYIQLCPNREFLLRMCYMEIYQEKITDLLTMEDKSVKIKEDADHQINVVGLEEEHVTSLDDVFEVIATGDARRRTAATKQNDRSSRSHSILRMIIESRETGEDDAVILSHLNFVDLAGSEKAGDNTGDRLKEGCAINKSLLALSQVICKLSEGDGEGYIGYRDSKLTRILQNALGGNSKTAIICTIGPTSIEESHSTLKFASRAKKIKNKPHLNEILNDGALLKKYRMEIQRLQKTASQMGVIDMQMEKNELVKKLKEKEDAQQEQDRLIENLQKLICTSHGSTPAGSKEVKKKLRRETWGGPKLKRRMSPFPDFSTNNSVLMPRDLYFTFPDLAESNRVQFQETLLEESSFNIVDMSAMMSLRHEEADKEKDKQLELKENQIKELYVQLQLKSETLTSTLEKCSELEREQEKLGVLQEELQLKSETLTSTLEKCTELKREQEKLSLLQEELQLKSETLASTLEKCTELEKEKEEFCAVEEKLTLLQEEMHLKSDILTDTLDKCTELGKEKENLQIEIGDLEDIIDKETNENTENKEKIAVLLTDIDHRRERSEKLEGQIKDISNSLLKLTHDYEKLQEDHFELKAWHQKQQEAEALKTAGKEAEALLQEQLSELRNEFNQKREEMSQLEINYKTQLSDKNQKLESLQSEVIDLKNEMKTNEQDGEKAKELLEKNLTELKDEISQKKEEIVKMESEYIEGLATKDAEVANLQEQLNTLKEEIEAEVKVILVVKSDLEQDNADHVEQIANLQVDVEKKVEAIANIEKEKQELMEQLQSNVKEAEEQKSAVETQLQEQTCQMKALVMEKDAEILKLRTQCESSEEQITKFQMQLAENDTNTVSQEQITNLEAKLVKKEEKIQQLEEEIVNDRNTLMEHVAKLETDAQQTEKELKEEKLNIEIQNSDIESKLEELKKENTMKIEELNKKWKDIEIDLRKQRFLLRGEVRELKEQNQHLQLGYDLYGGRCETLVEERNVYREEKAKWHETIADREEKCKEKETKYVQMNLEFHNIKQMMRKQTEEYEHKVKGLEGTIEYRESVITRLKDQIRRQANDLDTTTYEKPPADLKLEGARYSCNIQVSSKDEVVDRYTLGLLEAEIQHHKEKVETLTGKLKEASDEKEKYQVLVKKLKQDRKEMLTLREKENAGIEGSKKRKVSDDPELDVTAATPDESFNFTFSLSPRVPLIPMPPKKEEKIVQNFIPDLNLSPSKDPTKCKTQ